MGRVRGVLGDAGDHPQGRTAPGCAAAPDRSRRHAGTAFATKTARGQLADLELRHRRRARCEDRTRVAKDTGLRNLPLHDFTQNQIWCAIVALASELTAWIQMLTLADHDARRWEPKRLRLRLFSIAARLNDHAAGYDCTCRRTHPGSRCSPA